MDVLSFDELAAAVARNRRERMGQMMIAIRTAVNAEGKEFQAVIRDMMPGVETSGAARDARTAQNVDFLQALGGGA